MTGSDRLVKISNDADPTVTEYFTLAGSHDNRGLIFDSNDVLYSISRLSPELYKYSEYNGVVTRTLVAGSYNGYVDATGSAA